MNYANWKTKGGSPGILVSTKKQNPQKEPPPLDATGSAGPAQPAPACTPGCAAATVLLGIPGLLVTAVTQTQDGQTLVEVITDPAAEAPRCCPRCGKAATGIKEHPRTAPRDMFIGDRQVLLAWRRPGGAARPRAVNREASRVAARRQAPGPADLPAADPAGRGRRG